MILPDHKQKLLLALKKAKGTIGKLEQMVEDEVYCLDITQQFNAVMGLLRSANLTMLESHLQTCGAKRLGSKDSTIREDFAKELIKTLDVSSRK